MRREDLGARRRSGRADARCRSRRHVSGQEYVSHRDGTPRKEEATHGEGTDHRNEATGDRAAARRRRRRVGFSEVFGKVGDPIDELVDRRRHQQDQRRRGRKLRAGPARDGDQRLRRRARREAGAAGDARASPAATTSTASSARTTARCRARRRSVAPRGCRRTGRDGRRELRARDQLTAYAPRGRRSSRRSSGRSPRDLRCNPRPRRGCH